MNQPDHPQQLTQHQNLHYVVTDEAFLDNPCTAIKERKLFEGLKHIFLLQGSFSIDNYRAIGKAHGLSYAELNRMKYSHLRKGYIETVFV